MAEEYDRVVKAYNIEKEDKYIIAKEFKLPIELVDKRISEARKDGIVIRDPSTKEIVLDLFRKGKNKKEIAKTLDKTVALVNHYISKAITNEEIPETKTPREKVSELVEKGIIYPKRIAEELDISEDSARRYVWEIKVIQSEKSLEIEEKIIKLWKDGITSKKQIAEMLHIHQVTVDWYIKDLIEEGKITEPKKEKTTINKEKKTTNKEKVINLFNNGIKETSQIAEILQLSKVTVKDYINDAIREGKITKEKKERAETGMEKLKKLTDEGITDRKVLAEKTGLSQGTIIVYMGQLFPKEKSPFTTIELAGILYRQEDLNKYQIAERLNIRPRTAENYINIFKKKERAEKGIKRRNKKEELYELYSLGIIDVETLAERLELKKATVKQYIKERKLKKLNDKQKRKVDVMLKMINELPIDIAQDSNMQLYEVHDIIDSISEEGKNEIRNQFLQNRQYIYEKICKIRKEQGLSLKETLQQLEKTEESDKGRIELAEACYILGAKKACQRIAKSVEENTDSAETRKLATRLRKDFEMEFMVRDIRAEYKAGKISEEELRKKYNERFLNQILGMERMSYER